MYSAKQASESERQCEYWASINCKEPWASVLHFKLRFHTWFWGSFVKPCLTYSRVDAVVLARGCALGKRLKTDNLFLSLPHAHNNSFCF